MMRKEKKRKGKKIWKAKHGFIGGLVWDPRLIERWGTRFSSGLCVWLGRYGLIVGMQQAGT